MVTQQRKRELIVSEMSWFPQKPRRFRVQEIRNIFKNYVGQILYVQELVELERIGINVTIKVLN